MEPLSEPTNTVWPFPFTPQDWEQTPPAVQAYVRTLRDELAQLHDRVETLEARLTAEFHDLLPAAVIGLALQEASPAHDRHHAPQSGWETGPSGPSPGALAAHDRPGGAARAVCVWQHDVCPDHAVPYASGALSCRPIAMEVTHWVLHQGWCPDCGRWSKAQVPAEHATGYGPRFSALMGEVAGTYGNGRRMVQTFCASVLQVPISLGAIQKVLDRVTQAIEPHYSGDCHAGAAGPGQLY